MSKLSDLMKVDPLADAEKITGKSYKDDEGTSALGFLLHLGHVDEVKAAAVAENDTHYGASFAYALAVYRDLGFDMVLADEVVAEGDLTERYVVLWHPDGILGTLESYGGDGMNSAKIYYNVEADEALPWNVTSSGRYAIHEDGRKVWSGDHDGRTGLRASINGLREHGKFLSEWVDRPHLWLICYPESKAHDGLGWSEGAQVRKGITQERIDRLPEHVRMAITP